MVIQVCTYQEVPVINLYSTLVLSDAMHVEFQLREQFHNKPLTPMCDQDRISPYNINTILSRQVMKIKENIN